MYRNTNNPEKESRSNSSSESFVVFGTAFPETTEKDRRAGRSDAGQFVPVWKQEARDEQGRRRFHGAFTGGFSAGYFNTVGSKEGWEPSNFVSSRSARNERKEAKPEDYMDEEDLQDLAGARKLVATEEFDVLGGTERELAARKKLQEENSGGFDLLGSSLMGMIGPPKDSVGIRLLRKMGWRPGQGIGPRTTRRHKEEDEEGSDEDDDFDTTNITFAPRDTPIENFQAKKDTYGLGYDLLSSVPEVAEMKRLRELARQKGTNAAAIDSKNRSAFGVFERGADAFGLGAFDEHDGEEDDVYGGHEPSVLKNYHHSLYDENESGYTRDEIKAQQGLKRKRQTVSDSTNNKKCSDGRPPLNGFIVSDQKQQIGKWHAPPKVPTDFTGLHIITENTQLKAPNITRESVFSFEERGDALGEKPIETRSVFDYMPQHSKDKLDQAVSWFIDLGKDKSQLSDFPTVPKDVANLALRGFMPFGDNLKKQARYKNYLENQAGRLTEDGVPKLVLPIPEGLTYETGMKETDEFAKAARIFRPISAMMSGRFTSASETTKHVEVVNFEGGLKTEEQYRKEKEQMAKQMPEPEKKQLSQEAEAAAMSMFGSLTRTVKPFYPNRLVCKRFNVRNPHPNHDPTKDSDVGRTQAGSKDALSKEAMESLLNERLPLTFTSASASPSPSTATEEQVQDPLMNSVIPKPSDRKSDDKDEAALTTGIETANKASENDDEDDGGAPLDYERPSMDIFKAIFDDSDDEEEEEEEQEKNNAPEISVTTTMVNAQDDDEFIGPPAPPQPATVDISIERSNSTPTATTTEAPFRPMFKRASERREQAASMDNIVSEEVVVQPFKHRSSAHKRRHVSVSDDDDEEEEEDDERERSRSRHHKSSSSSRHHKSSKKSSSRKRSKSRDRSSRRKRSRSPTDHKGSSRHKKSKSSSKSTREHHHHRSSSSRKYKEEEAEHEFEGMWVEKEPVVIPQQKKEPNSSSSKKRMKASDMW